MSSKQKTAGQGVADPQNHEPEDLDVSGYLKGPIHEGIAAYCEQHGIPNDERLESWLWRSATADETYALAHPDPSKGIDPDAPSALPPSTRLQLIELAEQLEISLPELFVLVALQGPHACFAGLAGRSGKSGAELVKALGLAATLMDAPERVCRRMRPPNDKGVLVERLTARRERLGIKVKPRVLEKLASDAQCATFRFPWCPGDNLSSAHEIWQLARGVRLEAWELVSLVAISEKDRERDPAKRDELRAVLAGHLGEEQLNDVLDKARKILHRRRGKR